MNTNELIRKLSGLQLGTTLENEIADAVEIARAAIERLAKVQTNKDFHLWREKVLADLSLKATGLQQTYLALAVSVAYEQFKARGQNWFTRLLRRVWGGIVRAGLGSFLERHGAALLQDAQMTLSRLLQAQTNADIKAARDEAFAVLRAKYADARDNWIALILDGALSVLLSKGVRL